MYTHKYIYDRCVAKIHRVQPSSPWMHNAMMPFTLADEACTRTISDSWRQKRTPSRPSRMNNVAKQQTSDGSELRERSGYNFSTRGGISELRILCMGRFVTNQPGHGFPISWVHSTILNPAATTAQQLDADRVKSNKFDRLTVFLLGWSDLGFLLHGMPRTYE